VNLVCTNILTKTGGKAVVWLIKMATVWRCSTRHNWRTSQVFLAWTHPLTQDSISQMWGCLSNLRANMPWGTLICDYEFHSMCGSVHETYSSFYIVRSEMAWRLNLHFDYRTWRLSMDNGKMVLKMKNFCFCTRICGWDWVLTCKSTQIQNISKCKQQIFFQAWNLCLLDTSDQIIYLC
jgi:hypothetical protein